MVVHLYGDPFITACGRDEGLSVRDQSFAMEPEENRCYRCNELFESFGYKPSFWGRFLKWLFR